MQVLFFSYVRTMNSKQGMFMSKTTVKLTVMMENIAYLYFDELTSIVFAQAQDIHIKTQEVALLGHTSSRLHLTSAYKTLELSRHDGCDTRKRTCPHRMQLLE